MDAFDEDLAEITKLLMRYRDGFAALDAAALKDLWDPTHDGLSYVASERSAVLTDWDAIAAYYDQLPDGVSEDGLIVMHIEEVATTVLGDAAYSLCVFHFEADLVEQPDPFVVDGRASFVFARRPDAGWKLIHYHESST